MLTLEQLLPLRLPSGLADPALAQDLLLRSEGRLGELAQFLRRAAVRTVRTGHERIDDGLLSQLGWTPSRRN